MGGWNFVRNKNKNLDETLSKEAQSWAFNVSRFYSAYAQQCNTALILSTSSWKKRTEKDKKVMGEKKDENKVARCQLAPKIPDLLDRSLIFRIFF